MADMFCKIDSLAVRRLDCKETKTVVDKTEDDCVNTKPACAGVLVYWQSTEESLQ